MHTMNEKDFKIFEQFVKMSQPALKKVMSRWLRERYDRVVETKDYIYAEGTIPIALAAHMDTVFAKPVENLFYDTRKNVMWSPEGLGADDRAGVFAIYQIVKSGLRPHIILSTDEEKGCIGAGELAKLPCPFNKLHYIIQLDRHGTCDCVFYDCDNPEFTKYVEGFGFVEAIGSFTDITEYCPAWGVAGVNLSVGYYSEHTSCEILYVDPLLATIKKVMAMLQQSEIPKFPYVEDEYTGYKWATIYNYAGGWSNNPSHKYTCSHCKKNNFLEAEVFPVVGKDDKTKYFCSDCLVGRVNWCVKCWEAYEIDPEIEKEDQNYVCPYCSNRKGAPYA